MRKPKHSPVSVVLNDQERKVIKDSVKLLSESYPPLRWESSRIIQTRDAIPLEVLARLLRRLAILWTASQIPQGLWEPDDDDDDTQHKHKTGVKGKLKGGKQKKRDKTFGVCDPQFWDWWHQKKQADGRGDLITRTEALEEYGLYKLSTGKRPATVSHWMSLQMPGISSALRQMWSSYRPGFIQMAEMYQLTNFKND